VQQNLLKEVRQDVSSVHGKPAIARFLLRVGVGLVFLLFGIDKFRNPQLWLDFIPPMLAALLPFSKAVFLNIMGVVESIMGAALLLGFWVRPAAALASAMLVGIVLSSGYNNLAVRDFGLLMATLALLFLGGRRAKKFK
jgi:uncharacterized membrane protein YphA (DoxX/SURF4 family)